MQMYNLQKSGHILLTNEQVQTLANAYLFSDNSCHIFLRVGELASDFGVAGIRYLLDLPI